MKKINIKIDTKSITNLTGKTSWQKALFWAFLISFLAFSFSNIYILFKPLETGIEEIIQDEISSTNISFDKKTLEDIKKRQEPVAATAPTIGKNPFSPF